MASSSQQAPRAAASTSTTMGSGFARYVQAVGGQLQIIAVLGDDLFILRGTDTASVGSRYPSVATSHSTSPSPNR